MENSGTHPVQVKRFIQSLKMNHKYFLEREAGLSKFKVP